MYVLWVGNERRQWIEDISFLYADVPFDNIGERLGTYKTLRSQWLIPMTQGTLWEIVGDNDKPF